MKIDIIVLIVVASCLYLILDLTEILLEEKSKTELKEVVIQDGVVLIMSTRLGEDPTE